MGPSAASIRSAATGNRTRKLLEELAELGLRGALPSPKEQARNRGLRFAARIVFTRELESLTRSEAEATSQAAGAVCSSSVSGNIPGGGGQGSGSKLAKAAGAAGAIAGRRRIFSGGLRRKDFLKTSSRNALEWAFVEQEAKPMTISEKDVRPWLISPELRVEEKEIEPLDRGILKPCSGSRFATHGAREEGRLNLDPEVDPFCFSEREAPPLREEMSPAQSAVREAYAQPGPERRGQLLRRSPVLERSRLHGALCPFRRRGWSAALAEISPHPRCSPPVFPRIKP